MNRWYLRKINSTPCNGQKAKRYFLEKGLTDFCKFYSIEKMDQRIRLLSVRFMWGIICDLFSLNFSLIDTNITAIIFRSKGQALCTERISRRNTKREGGVMVDQDSRLRVLDYRISRLMFSWLSSVPSVYTDALLTETLVWHNNPCIADRNTDI
jgi:hypothetical protein